MEYSVDRSTGSANGGSKRYKGMTEMLFHPEHDSLGRAAMGIEL